MTETMKMLIETYAEEYLITTNDVEEGIKYGVINGKMLFEAWLDYEGIIGYAREIINIFDTCEDAGIKITNIR